MNKKNEVILSPKSNVSNLLAIMCSNKILFAPGSGNVDMKARENGEPAMDFRQVTFATSCLKMLANRRSIPIVQLLDEMMKKEVFPAFYNLLNADPAYTKVQIVNRLQKFLMV